MDSIGATEVPDVLHDSEDRFIRAFMDLLGSYDYSDITITMLSQKAGLNRSTFYRKVGTMEGLVIRIYRRMVDMIVESAGMFKNGGWGGYSTYIHGIFGVFYENRDDLLLLHHRGLTSHLGEVLRESFIGDAVLPPEKMYPMEYHIGGVMSWMTLWLDREMSDDPRTMAELTIKTMSGASAPILMDSEHGR